MFSIARGHVKERIDKLHEKKLNITSTLVLFEEERNGITWEYFLQSSRHLVFQVFSFFKVFSKQSVACATVENGAYCYNDIEQQEARYIEREGHLPINQVSFSSSQQFC